MADSRGSKLPPPARANFAPAHANFAPTNENFAPTNENFAPTNENFAPALVKNSISQPDTFWFIQWDIPDTVRHNSKFGVRWCNFKKSCNVKEESPKPDRPAEAGWLQELHHGTPRQGFMTLSITNLSNMPLPHIAM